MKKLLLFTLAVLVFAACTQNDVEELAANRADVPETLTVGFEGDDTRIQLNEAQKTVWNEGDLLSVFYFSNANQKWQFQGETGERVGSLKRVANAEATAETTYNVVVYPYSDSYFLNPRSCALHATLPAVQHYAEGSYGVGDNLMVAQSEFTQFSLKSVCGWLKVQLTGNGEKVTRLTLKGNNDEQLAGLVYVDTATTEATLVAEMGSFGDAENGVGGGLVPDNSLVKSITLNCGEGVELGYAAKSFYIAVPPQTFEKGATVTVECSNGTCSTIGTTEAFTIQRNHILPINCGQYDGVLPEVYELAYRTNDGKKLDPMTIEGFGGEFKENQFDASTSEGKLVFAGAITTIPNQAFGLCENLAWIDLPLGITSIGASAFSGCSSMVEITIPASVASVGEEAFKGCTGRAYINCNMPGVDYWDNNPVCFKSASFTKVVIGDSVTTIGKYAFYDCDSLTSVTIPNSVTTIGNYAFEYCDSLTSVTIPDSVTTIGDGAFTGCYSLKSITIPDSVTTIGKHAFQDCDSLTSITIPDSVTTIGGYAFYSCSSLTSVYCKATTPPAGDSAMFIINASDRTIYVPEESVRQYKIAEYWSEYADAIVGYDFENGEFAQDTTEYTFTVAHLGHSTAGGIQVVFADANATYQLFATFFTEEKYIPAGIYYATGYICLLSPESYMYANGENHKFNQESNSTENSIVVELAADDTYTFTFNNLLFGKEYVATGSWTGKIEGLGANVKEDEFQATHVATQWMWGGYSQSSWGNYYIVSGEGFSMQVHFCTDVATETTLAAGDYKWGGQYTISNSTPEKFSTKAIKINGADVYAGNGEMSVTEKNGSYTIKLSIVNRDTNETYGILFNGKLNETNSEVKESVVNVTQYNDGGQDGTLHARIFKLYDNDGNQAHLYINADAVDNQTFVVTPGTYTWVSIGQVGELSSYFATNNIVVNGESKTAKSGTLVIEESGEFTMSLTMTDLSKVKFVVSKEYLGK